MNPRESRELNASSWYADVPEEDKTHETRVYEISTWFMSKDRATNEDVYKEFPGKEYKKAWKSLKDRGVRSTQMFYNRETKEWVYFP